MFIKTPLPSTGYSTKKSIHKFFGTVVKKIMSTLHALIFSFIILNLVKKVEKDKKYFHLTTVTVDLCIKEVKLILRRAL